MTKELDVDRFLGHLSLPSPTQNQASVGQSPVWRAGPRGEGVFGPGCQRTAVIFIATARLSSSGSPEQAKMVPCQQL